MLSEEKYINRDILIKELEKAYEAQEGLRERKLLILRFSVFLTGAIAAFLSSGYLGSQIDTSPLTALFDGNLYVIAFLTVFSWIFGGLGFTYAKNSVYDTKITDYILNTLRTELLSPYLETDTTGLLSLSSAIYPKEKHHFLKTSSVAGFIVPLPGAALYGLVLINYCKIFGGLSYPLYGTLIHLFVIITGIMWGMLCYYGYRVIFHRYMVIKNSNNV